MYWRNLFDSFKIRKLLIYVKFTIINTLARSKLIYIANVLKLSDKKFIQDINRLLHNFLWYKTDNI